MKKVLRVFVIIFVLISCANVCGISQTSETKTCEDLNLSPDSEYNLLYAVEIFADKKESQFLIPTIENLLRRLNFPNTNGTPRFADVTNVNRLNEDQEVNQYIRKTFNAYLSANNVKFQLDSIGEVSKQKVIRSILEHDDFLYIKINDLGDRFIEYQFYRYLVNEEFSLKAAEFLEKRNETHFGDLPTHEFLNSSSIFINLEGSPDQQISNLQKAIKQVFCETNNPPVANIASTHSIENGITYFAVGDTIQITAQVFDNDSRSELISYSWRQIEGNQNLPGIELQDNLPRQTFVMNEEGCHTIGLKIHDGIVYSKEEAVLKVCVIQKPQLIAWGKNTNNPNWSTEIRVKNTPDKQKVFLYQHLQLVSGLIKANNPDNVELILTHSEFNPDKIRKSTSLYISERPKLEGSSLTSYEEKNDYGYSLAAFYQIDSIEVNGTLQPGFILRSRASEKNLPPAGVYRFYLYAKEHDIISEPVLLTTVLKKYSAWSFHLTPGLIFGNDPVNIGDSTFIPILSVAIGARLQRIKNFAMNGGTQVRVIEGTLLPKANIYYGFDFGYPTNSIRQWGINANFLIPLSDLIRENPTNLGISAGLFFQLVESDWVTPGRFGIGYIHEPGVVRHGVYFNVSAGLYPQRAKFSKKYRN